MSLKRNLDTRRNREYWLFVQKTAEEVNKWPEWQRLGTKAIPQLVLLSNKLALLEGSLLAAKEDLQIRTEEFKTTKEKFIAEINGYRKEIKRIEMLISKTRKEAT